MAYESVLAFSAGIAAEGPVQISGTGSHDRRPRIQATANKAEG
jgi:hypothetical protein